MGERAKGMERPKNVTVTTRHIVKHIVRSFVLSLRGSSTNNCWRQKTRVTVLSRGVVCVILRLAV